MKRARANGACGFTLLEVLLAIALVLMLVGAVGSFVWNLLDRRATLLGVGRDVHAAGALMDRIEGDLLAAIAGDETAGAGVDGTGTSLRILTRGVWIDVSGGGSGEGGGGGGDLQRCEYRFDAASARVTTSRKPARAEGEAGEEVVSDRVERVRFRYFDGREWVGSFDSLSKGDLPVAVEVAVWLALPGKPPRVEAVGGGDDGVIGGNVDISPERGVEGDGADDPGMSELGGRRWGAPDRLRVIVVPDGPVTAWRDRS